jgi:hypothetical protein
MTVRRDDGFTDETMKRVLQRAIELDAQAEARVSEVELRTIAGELGVTQASLDTALQELSTPRVSLRAPHAYARGLFTSAFLGLVTGALFLNISLVNGYWFGDGNVYRVLGTMVAATGLSAVFRARHAEPLRYHATNTVAWASAFAGLWLADPNTTLSAVSSRIVGILIIEGWIVSTTIGLLIQRRRVPPSRTGNTSPPTGSARPEHNGRAAWSQRWQSALERLRGLLHVQRIASRGRVHESMRV